MGLGARQTTIQAAHGALAGHRVMTVVPGEETQAGHPVKVQVLGVVQTVVGALQIALALGAINGLSTFLWMKK